MTKDPQIDTQISRWLEEEAPTRIPDRVLRSTFEQTRKSRQDVGWRALLRRLQLPQLTVALGGAAVIVIAAALAAGLYFNGSGVGGPPLSTASPAPANSAFVGFWEATDVDGSHETMEVIARPNGTFGVRIRDDVASVCDGVSSTVTGTAEAKEPGAIVIQQPDYACDDNSQPQAGDDDPPVEVSFRNLTFAYEADGDELHDSLGLVWSRAGTAPTPAPTASRTPEPSADPLAAIAGNWENDQESDGGHQAMTVTKRPDGTYEVTIRDDIASVCDRTPSTLTGVAEVAEPGTIVIARPDYQCDDGSEPQALSGPPLLEQLRNLGFTYDSDRDTVRDSGGLVFTRVHDEPNPTESPEGEPVPFAGNWEATDGPPDSSNLTMEVVALPDGTFDMTILDDAAAVCDGASSTMTGVAVASEPGTIVIAQPDYQCDDDSEAQEMSGPPLVEQLRNMGFTYDSDSDELHESLGLIWSRIEEPVPSD